MKHYIYSIASILTITIHAMHNHPATRGAKRKIEALQAIKTLSPEQATEKLQAFIKKNRILPSNPYTLEELQTLVNQGADVNTTVNQGTTVLMRAAVYENLDAMRALIKAGANVNQARKQSDTALSCAVFYNRLTAAQLLIESGCSTSTLTFALTDAALRNPSNEMVQLLLDAGADPRWATPYWHQKTIADLIYEKSVREATYSNTSTFKEIWQLCINKYPELRRESPQAVAH